MIKIFKLLCVAFCKWRSLQHPLINQRGEDGYGLQSLPLKWSAVTCHPLYSKTTLLTWYNKCLFSIAQSAYNGWATNIFESAICRWMCDYAYVCVYLHIHTHGASLIAQLVKNPPAMWGTWVGSLVWEEPLEEGMAKTLQYPCLANPHGQRSLAGYNPWGWKEMDVTERLSTEQNKYTHRCIHRQMLLYVYNV